MDIHNKYMIRCIELAERGHGYVSPNPMVGSVIVHKGKIIGEGYHRKYGEAHAEVNAINSVKNKELLKDSTLYVSLEPCAHVGKTPSCADLIVKTSIPEIVIGSVDPYYEVDGKGISRLRNASLNVICGVLEKECISLNRRFYTFHQKKRPYIILKWAQTADGFIDHLRNSGTDIKPAWITNEYCKTLVHKWRTEESAILVGKNTVIFDDPQLTSRNWSQHNPLRIVFDRMCELNNTYRVFDSQSQTIIFNSVKDEKINNIRYIKIDFSYDIIPQALKVLHENDIQSVIIEGGTKTLNQFISHNMWDEARVFKGNRIFRKGVKAPSFNSVLHSSNIYGNSILETYYNNEYIQR